MVTCMAEKNRLTVLIDGKEYTIVSEQPKEHIQAVALCADTKMREVRNMDSSKRLSTSMVAVLTTLNLAEDYINIKNDFEKASERAEDANLRLAGAKQKLAEYENLLRSRDGEINRLKQELVRLQTLLNTKDSKNV